MHGLIASRDSTTFDRIVALDLGKFNSVACVYDPATQQHVFKSIGTSPQTVHDLLAENAGGEDPSRVLVIFETCDAAGWVHDIAAALGFTIVVANPCDEAWRWRKVKRKTDRDDALKLVRLSLVGQLRSVHMPAPQQRQRRRLIHHRKALVERQTQSKNAVRSIFSQQGMSHELPRGHKLWSQAGVEQVLRVHARPLAQCEVEDLWRGRLHVELELLEALARQIALVDKKLEELGRAATIASSSCGPCRASVRGWPRRWSLTWMTRSGSAMRGRSAPTRDSCPSNWRAGR